MSLRFQLLLLFLAPALLVGGVWALGQTIPVPHLGRNYVLRVALPDPDARPDLPVVHGPQDPSRPLVVIDAGHGGHDPGASASGYREKAIVLGLALELRDRLLENGGIRVALTREDDRFLALEERSEIARLLGADLFLSIHADSAGEQEGVQGATIYTLSSRASSQAAERFAARENNANRINGIELTRSDDTLNAILVDLSQRRSQEQADEFARLILREGEGLLRFHPDPLRSAALLVLRAPDVPSVLFESGYITNSEEAERLASVAGRRSFATVMERAIRVYFARTSGQAGSADVRPGFLEGPVFSEGIVTGAP